MKRDVTFRRAHITGDVRCHAVTFHAALRAKSKRGRRGR